MEDLGKRAALTYCGLSLLAWFMKSSMEYQGANFSRNPAWQLVSGLFTLFKWSWWLFLGMAALFGIVLLATRIIDHYGAQKQLEQERIHRHAERVRSNARHEEEVRQKVKEDKRREIERNLQAEEQRLKKEENIKSLQRRTPQEAVMLALRDFCKGGS